MILNAIGAERAAAESRQILQRTLQLTGLGVRLGQGLKSLDGPDESAILWATVE
jgi:hypothetical protein